MQFGKIIEPGLIDFSLPKTANSTVNLLSHLDKNKEMAVFVGCAKWNRAELKGFYPRGTKDELTYYSSQFNAIELNATFYNLFSPNQFKIWKEKTPKNFKFFPKLSQEISHFKRLKNVASDVNRFLDNVLHLEKKLGTVFLQLHDNFDPDDFNKLANFIISWPKEIPLSIECRNTNWFTAPVIFEEFYKLLEENKVSNSIVDTAGRRDIVHMTLTNEEAFIRFVGANHPSDYDRLDDWAMRLKEWKELGLRNVHFFIHQNIEESSPLLASYFIKKINTVLGTNLKIPNEEQQMSLF